MPAGVSKYKQFTSGYKRPRPSPEGSMGKKIGGSHSHWIGFAVLMFGTYFLLRQLESIARITLLNSIMLVIASCLFVLAITIGWYLTTLHTQQTKNKRSLELATESGLDDLASLTEIDDLLREQNQYFGLQLAIALREKATHFPIRVADVLEIRKVLGTHDSQSDESLNAQYHHLSKIIDRLENGHAID